MGRVSKWKGCSRACNHRCSGCQSEDDEDDEDDEDYDNDDDIHLEHE